MQWPTIFTAMITPFDEHGEVDEERAGFLSHWLVEHGTGGIILAGTTGESPSLSIGERHRLFRAVRAAVGDAVPVWMGTGSNDTRHSMEMSRQAEKWGVDGILLVCPYYNKPPQEGLFRHFEAIAASVSVPVMLYNVPSRTGVNLEPETAVRVMAACPNVLAVKEAGGSLEQLETLVRLCPPDVRVYAGDDAYFYAALARGGQGVVSVAAHLAGPQMAAMEGAFRNGDIEQAEAIHHRLTPLFRELFRLSNPIPLKWALNHLGFRVGPVRLPLVIPEDTTVFAELAALLAELEVKRPQALRDVH